MTVSEAKRSLLEFFKTNDAFTLTHDLRKVIGSSTDGAEDRLVVEVALTKLEDAEVVTRCAGSDCWVLTKPLSTYPQQVRLSGETALLIAQIVNTVCQQMGGASDIVDPLSVKEMDIQRLCALCDGLVCREPALELAREPLGFSVADGAERQKLKEAA